MFASVQLVRRYGLRCSHQRVVLARPAPRHEAVTRKNFEITNARTDDVGDDALLCETLILSVDPYMRCRFFPDGTGVDYVDSFQVGEPITSAGIGRVVKVGKNLQDKYNVNDIVADGAFGWPWATIAAIDPNSPNVYLEKIPKALEYVASPSAVLSVIGQPGLTAYFGIERFAKPKKGDTIVVSSAAGAVGTVVCQLAKRRGCKVIGLTSTDASFLSC
eukprot:m.2764 g.2764  ORF g.2764 m.2764 type:complete len:218 (+) comp2585_c0_seq1:118-771(+)